MNRASPTAMITVTAAVISSRWSVQKLATGTGTECMKSEQAKGDAPLAALPRRPRAVLLDGMGTLVALEPPHERLRARLREAAGVEVSGRTAKDAFKAEIAHYLAHHLEGRDEHSLDRLRSDCAAVLQRALGKPAAALDP